MNLLILSAEEGTIISISMNNLKINKYLHPVIIFTMYSVHFGFKR